MACVVTCGVVFEFVSSNVDAGGVDHGNYMWKKGMGMGGRHQVVQLVDK